MKNEDFNALLCETFGLVDAVLGGKAKEYAADTDRLHNFKQAARLDLILLRALVQEGE